MVRNGYQHMVHDYYVAKLRALNARRDEELRSVTSRRDVLRYQARVRRAVTRAFSPVPRRTPLNATTTGMVELEHLSIEKVQFESRPACLVTANLYLPKDPSGRAPAVLVPCGHTNNGKAAPLYQQACQRLARSGFVALIYDPFSQGERDQYHGIQHELVSQNTFAHNMMGKQLELLGEFFGMWRVWDGIRALDYLISRPEVDASCIGVAGNSGGGTLSEWLWAVDERITMAAPSCFVTTYLANLENEEPQDSEQYAPGLMGAGLEMVDPMVLRAPAPALLMGQAYDYFDRRGLEKAYRDLWHFYQILGRPANLRLFIGPHGHGFHRENQEAMVNFFADHAGLPRPISVEHVEVLPDDALQVTRSGNTVVAGAEPIYKSLGEKAREISRRRKSTEVARLRRRIRATLGISSRRKLPRYRVLRPDRFGERRFGRYAIETEEGIRVILRKLVTQPERSNTLEAEEEVTLYIPHLSAEGEVDQYAPASGSQPSPIYALDPRGMGESLPEGGPDGFFHPYGMDYMFHGMGLMLGESYLGRRVHDVLSTIDLLGHVGARSVNLIGRGQGAIIALFASLLDPLIGRVVLRSSPRSFEEWTQVPIVAWPAANFPRGVLKSFDIHDLIAASDGRISVVEPWGPDMKPVPNAADARPF